ncbi:MAG: DUF1109 family protein [Rhodospirillales bacterium]|nr:DUF1109 family protein [Rhodospirillales bacterium]
MQTDTLVQNLAADLLPVRRLPPPWVRFGWWLLVSAPAVGVVALLFGLRPDLGARFADPVFVIEEAAALATALTGAYAALCAGLPDRPDWKIWVPLVPMMVWLGSLGTQCLDVALRVGPQGLAVTSDPMCVPAVALGGLIPAVAIFVQLRRGGRFRSTHACLCGALGAAALAGAALRLYHPEDAAIMVIVWQFGSVALLSLAAGAVGRLLLAMPARGAA